MGLVSLDLAWAFVSRANSWGVKSSHLWTLVAVSVPRYLAKPLSQLMWVLASDGPWEVARGYARLDQAPRILCGRLFRARYGSVIPEVPILPGPFVLERICESVEDFTPWSVPKLGSQWVDDGPTSQVDLRLEDVEPRHILVLQCGHQLRLGFEVEVGQTRFVTGLLNHLERLR